MYFKFDANFCHQAKRSKQQNHLFDNVHTSMIQMNERIWRIQIFLDEHMSGPRQGRMTAIIKATRKKVISTNVL